MDNSNLEIYKSLTRLIDMLMDKEDVETSMFGDIKFEVIRMTGKVRPKDPEKNWLNYDAIHILDDLYVYLEKKVPAKAAQRGK